MREAQLAARLSHPNVVGVYDILEEDAALIVMELVPFRSLRDALAEDGPMSPAEAALGLSGWPPCGRARPDRTWRPTSCSAPGAGWCQVSHDGHYVYIRDPANSGIFLLIDQSDQPKPNPLADWRQQAANRQAS